MSLQDSYLQQFKESGEMLTVFLQNGYQMTGKLIDYDKYVIMLEVSGKRNVIYKHAISTFVS